VPTDLVRLLGRAEVELAFRDLVRRLLPDDEPAILDARQAGRDRDAERVWAFCSAFEHRYFPLYECEEPDQLLYCIGFVRLGWSYEAFHDLDLRPGTLLLRAVCAEPYEASVGARVPLLEAVEHLGVPREVLRQVPADGLAPADLHAALDGTSYAAAAQFADWTWGHTDLAFLDCDDEMEVVDAEWSDENVQELDREWQKAKALMDRVTALEVWLEQNPALHFGQLIEAALARSANLATAEGSAHVQEVSRCEPADNPVHTSLAVQPPAAA
jgi:hypothetical protein